MSQIQIIDRPVNVYPEGYHPDTEMMGGPRLCESAGYVPKQVQLQQLIDAGGRLDTYYRQQYPDLTPADAEYDPTAQYGYDFFDWHYDVSVVKSRQAECEEYQRFVAAAKDSTQQGNMPIVPDSAQANPSPLNDITST